MTVVATVLRWAFLVAGAAVLAAFLVSAVRARIAGTRFGELVDVLENRWFAPGQVFFAVLAGLAGSWAAGWAGGTRPPLLESVPILFPLGIVAAFVVRRTDGGEGGDEDAGRDGRAFLVKLLALLAAPLLLGGVMTGW
ncbi:hypothetical protein RI138_12105 [Streptomyces sp. C11-1]|uniref:Integral membrane protein n=1 Tax=Streptomyces durocortorensis TaxID=2811104 RepID=A0ABY9VUB0_9ACTN|nr:hypothetical protein [Streptomyces durocortorensis]WNF27519.1 hypothetical protein RI138_12105 [Streptomyces durocortorensis]